MSIRRVKPKLPWFPRQPILFDAASVKLCVPETMPPPLLREPKEHDRDRRERYMVEAEGPAGRMVLDVPPCVRILRPEPGRIELAIDYPNARRMRCHWGTTRARLANMLEGVARGWCVRLRLSGVGYRAALVAAGQEPCVVGKQKVAKAIPGSVSSLVFKLGFIHPIVVPLPPGVQATVPDPEHVELRGPDKHQLTQMAAMIRAYRKPEPYNQKGIFVNDETIEKKKK